MGLGDDRFVLAVAPVVRRTAALAMEPLDARDENQQGAADRGQKIMLDPSGEAGPRGLNDDCATTDPAVRGRR